MARRRSRHEDGDLRFDREVFWRGDRLTGLGGLDQEDVERVLMTNPYVASEAEA